MICPLQPTLSTAPPGSACMAALGGAAGGRGRGRGEAVDWDFYGDEDGVPDGGLHRYLP